MNDIFTKKWWSNIIENLLVEVTFDSNDTDLIDKVANGFKLQYDPKAFGVSFVTKTGKASPLLSDQINKWIKTNFPNSNIYTKFEKVYGTISFLKKEDLKENTNNEYKPTLALYPGNFKPPHRGHFDVVKQLLGKADQVAVLLSPEEQDGISADEGVEVWNVYKHLLEPNVEVRITAGNPFEEVKKVIENNPDTKFIVAFGKNEEKDFEGIEKYRNVKVFNVNNVEDLSATQFRDSLKTGEASKIQAFLPDGVNPIDIEAIFNPQYEEEVPQEPNPLDNQITPNDEQPLQELQLGAGERSPYQDYIKANAGAVQDAAQYFNYPIPDLQYAFYAGMETVMSDDTWSKLQNSTSYKVTSLEEVIKMAQKEGIDLLPYIAAIRNEEQLPFPLVFNYAPNKYYLVAGNIILSLYKALNVIPIVLMATINVNDKKYIDQRDYELQEIEEEENNRNSNLKKALGKFMKFATEALQLHNPPAGLILSQDTNESRSKHTFGHFTPETKKIWLYVKNRNTADVLRTLAHELVHLKQAEDNRLDQNSGETGSPIENEANAMAGVLLRNFGKDNEFIYETLDSKKSILQEYSQKIINQLTDKFKQEKPDLEINTIQSYINRFSQIKDNPNVTQKDITKYTWGELENIVSSNQPKRIKAGKLNDGEPSSDTNLIYNQDGLRIYVGKTKKACIKYGNGYSFCISARGEDNGYDYYRHDAGGTPYFIFDDTKSSKQNEDGKFIDPDHLLVLFKYLKYDDETDAPMEHYSITNANNDGDKEYQDDPWTSALYKIKKDYPKLKDLIDIFQDVSPNDEEEEEHRIIKKYNRKIYDLNKDDPNYDEKRKQISDEYRNELSKLRLVKEALDSKKNYPIEDEIFSAFHGRYVFDVSKAYDLINKGEVKTKIETREPGAMHFMAHPEFSKTDPAKYKKLKLDYDKPLGLNVNFYDPYLKETLWILIDGNHRTRKAVEENHNGKYILVPNTDDTAKFLTINNDIPKKLSIDDED
jgi:nicotinamide mononucleotide adenylyltransferase/Zn-dependent peptidase ImmA (M78 family)